MVRESVGYNATLVFAERLELFGDGNKNGALNEFQEAVNMAPDFTQEKEMIQKLKVS